MCESVRSSSPSLWVFVLPLVLAACAGSAPNPPKYYAPAPGATFRVEAHEGETLRDLARRYSVVEDDLLALNDLRDLNRVIGGQVVRVPAYGRDRSDSATARVATAVPAKPAAPVPVRPASVASASAIVPARNVAAQVPPPIAGTTAEKFLWPVEGRVIWAFGPSKSGERNDGINIRAVRGSPVRAASAGTVSYAGNELRNYGNLVLIRHDNGYVTAYAHAETLTVKRGERVTRGQVIAFAGATGNVSEPQLHFELRIGTRPLDPIPYLTVPGVASN